MFFIFVILGLIFPSQGEGLSEGQRVILQGEGRIYLRGEDCVLLLESGEELVSPEENEIGLTTVVVNAVNTEMQGLFIAGEECTLKSKGDLEVTFPIHVEKIFETVLLTTIQLVVFLFVVYTVLTW
jgi:hypothetical protein